MRIKYILVGLVGMAVGVLLTSVVVVLAGNPAGPGTAPGATLSYTLEDIYNRLNTGAEVEPSPWSEPVVAPGVESGHTLSETMALAPQISASGAVSTEVAEGKTFWGLTAGEWGPQVGTGAPCDCAGGTLNGTRWCDNGDGTVTDLLGYNGKGQCLVWLKNAGCIGIKQWANATTWDDAQTESGILYDGSTHFPGSSDCGLDDGSVEGDWRLPTKSELVAITSGTEYVRSEEMRAFTGVRPNFYWSSSTSAVSTDYAWCVDLPDGFVYESPKAGITYLWPVRGGQ